MTLKWCHVCKKDDDAEEILEQFELPFPEGYEHIICSHETLERPGDFRTQDDAQTWLKAFESSTQTTWRIGKTYPNESPDARNEYRAYGASSGERMWDDLQKRLDVYNGEQGETCAKMCSDGTNTIVAEDECHCPLDEICPERSGTVHDRKLFYEIATGMVNIADDWFAGLAFEREDILPNPSIASNQEQLATVLPAGEEQVMDGEGSAAGEESAGRIQQLEDGLKTMFEELAQKLRQDESFEAAARCLRKNYRKIKMDSGLVSACCSFGKERRSSTAATTTTVKLLRMRAQKGLQTSTAIGVQPTAVARRKAPLGGRRALQMGRPPKRARREHNYGKVKEGGGVLPRRPTPHSLSQCVADGVALGGTHSRK